jgi:hypothetical protein
MDTATKEPVNMETKTVTTLSIPVQISESATAYAESLKMILQHVAEFHVTVVDIISDKYKIPVDEIMNTVTSDSRYTNMLVDPKIHHLTCTNVKVTMPTTTVPTTMPTTTTVPTRVKTTEKKIKIKPKSAIISKQTSAITTC